MSENGPRFHPGTALVGCKANGGIVAWDRLRAEYVGLLMDLTQRAAPNDMDSLCDRIERAIAARRKQPRPMVARRVPYWRVQP